jgi:hypothetical protein
VHILARVAFEAAVDCAEEAYRVALLELSSYLSRAGRYYSAGSFMANGDRILAENKTLVIRLEEHDIGVAERRAGDLD